MSLSIVCSKEEFYRKLKVDFNFITSLCEEYHFSMFKSRTFNENTKVEIDTFMELKTPFGMKKQMLKECFK